MTSAPARILYLTPHGERAGAERMLDALIRGHRSRTPQRYEPMVICGTPGTFAEGLRRDGIATEIRQLRMRRLLPAVLDLRRYLQRHRIRLVHSTMAHYHQFAWLAARGLGIPTIWFNHGPCSRGWWKGLAHAMPADAVIVEGEFVRECHRGFTLGPAPRIIRYALDDRWTRDNAGLRASARARLRLADDELGIGILGRIEEWKRQHLFLEAVARIGPEAAARCRFFVAGEPALGRGQEYFDRLKSQLARHPHRDRIQLLGYVDSEEFLEAIDIAVHCTDDEPFGYVILEAMAKRKVVIAADSGGPKEMIVHGSNGFLQDPTDTAALASLLDIAVRNYHAFTELRDNARKTVRASFNTQRLVDEFEDVYDRLISDTARRV